MPSVAMNRDGWLNFSTESSWFSELSEQLSNNVSKFSQGKLNDMYKTFDYEYLNSSILPPKLTQSVTHCRGVHLYPAYMAGLFNIPLAAMTPVVSLTQKHNLEQHMFTFKQYSEKTDLGLM